MSQAVIEKQAPPEAFRWDVPVLFATGNSTEDEHRVEIQARTPGVVNHWYWGRMIHDMAGCRHKDRLPIDWRHDADEIIGYADSITADDNGLAVSALIQSLHEGDRASTIIKRGRKGTPYESSIYWDEFENVLEYLDEGFVTTVNGQQVEGPLVIAREWNLRGLAITPYGVEATTKTQFSAGSSAESISVSLKPVKDAMSKTTTPEAPQPTKDSAAESQPTKTEATTPTPTPVPAKATRDAVRAELNRYMERFGNDRGSQYFKDSLSFADACEKEIEHLQKQLAVKDSELETVRKQIASVNTGELTPVDTGAQNKDSDKSKPTWQDQFKKAGS